jgi:hypothetical protein
VTDQPNSPHVLAAKTSAQFLVAIAAPDLGALELGQPLPIYGPWPR